MAKIEESVTISSDRAVTVSWSWPTLAAGQSIEINSAAWHWTASRYAVPYYDPYHNEMIPTNGGNGHNREGITVANLGVTTSTTSMTAYFDMHNDNPGTAEIRFVIDYTIINNIPASTPSAGNATVGSQSVVTIFNSSGLASVWHVTTWSIGTYSESVETSAYVNTASLTIPDAWANAISGASGTMTIELTTYPTGSTTPIGTNTISVVLNKQPDSRASTVSVPAATIDSYHTITFSNPDLAHVKHQVKWEVGSYSYTETTAVGAPSIRTYIPANWGNAFRTSTSTTMTVTVQTYSSDTIAIGSPVVKQVTLSCPNYTPTVTARITVVDPAFGMCLQNHSRVTVEITSAAGAYGSTLAGYAIGGPNLFVHADTGTSEVLTESGTLSYECMVADSRGVVGKCTVTVSCYAYSPPRITRAEAYRCGASTLDPDFRGTRVAYIMNWTFSPLYGNNPLNECSVKLMYGDTPIKRLDPPNQNTLSLLYSYASETLVYKVVFTVTDTVGESAVFEVDIPTTQVYIYFDKTKNSIGIGCYPQHNNSLELANNYHLYIGNQEITPPTSS